jgi:hypothetical protein
VREEGAGGGFGEVAGAGRVVAPKAREERSVGGFDRVGAQENLRPVLRGVELTLAVAVSGQALRRDAVVPVLEGLLN